MEAATRNRIEARIQWVEDEMEAVFASRPAGVELYRIQRYHLGWLSARFEPLPRDLARRYGGKKLRGVLCLLACEAAGGAPGAAVPADAADATTAADALDHSARFGRAFGLAFQARDDYLGIWGRSEQTGKPVGADIQRGKRSLPIVHALEQTALRGDEAAAQSELRIGLERREVERVLAALEETGSQAFVEQVAAHYTAEALAHLDAIAPLSPEAGGGARDLRAIAAYALGREE